VKGQQAGETNAEDFKTGRGVFDLIQHAKDTIFGEELHGLGTLTVDFGNGGV